MPEMINCEFCGKPRPDTVSTCPYCKPTRQQLFNSRVNKTAESVAKTIDDKRTEIEKKEHLLNITTIKCKRCNKPVSTKAEICPYCRTRLKTSKLTKTVAAVFILLIPLSMCINSNSSNNREKYNRFDAADAAERRILSSLKAPSTAKFPSKFDWNINDGNSYFSVYSYVDAQNSFGAMMRTNFACIVYKSDNYALCDFGGLLPDDIRKAPSVTEIPDKINSKPNYPPPPSSSERIPLPTYSDKIPYIDKEKNIDNTQGK